MSMASRVRNILVHVAKVIEWSVYRISGRVNAEFNILTDSMYKKSDIRPPSLIIALNSRKNSEPIFSLHYIINIQLSFYIKIRQEYILCISIIPPPSLRFIFPPDVRILMP